MKPAEFFLEDVIRMYRELVPESVRGTRFVRAGLEEPGILGCAVIAGRGV